MELLDPSLDFGCSHVRPIQKYLEKWVHMLCNPNSVVVIALVFLFEFTMPGNMRVLGSKLCILDFAPINF